MTFTVQVGQTLRKATAGSGKKLSLELGGKSPFIVFESSDLDAAVEGVVDAIYFNQGQVQVNECKNTIYWLHLNYHFTSHSKDILHNENCLYSWST